MKIRKTAGIAAIGLLALAGALAAPGASQASVARASSAPPTARESYAARIRAQMGLESDLPYIRKLESQRGLNTTALGTPVTGPELAELNARRSLGGHVNAVQHALSSSSAFGGTWLKQSGDGTVVVSLTSAPTAAITQAVNSALPANSSVEFVQVLVSYSRLNSLYQSIISAPLAANGIENASIDTADDTVAVGVATQADVAAVYAKYGHTGLTATVAAAATATASRDFTSGPLYGGEWVAFGNSIHTLCTMGFADFENAAGQFYSLTAGHCALNGTAAYQGESTSDPAIGSGVHGNHTYNQPNNTTECDCEGVGPITSSQATDQILVAGNAHYTFDAIGSPYVGESTCHSGASSYQSNGGNIVCGTVVSDSSTVSVSSDFGTFTLTDSIEWSGSLISGDSGAPMGDGPALVGIASATNGSDAWFSAADLIQYVTGLAFN